MRFLTLEECKKHLVVDHNEDDEMIASKAASAENAIENYLNIDLEYEFAEIPEDIKEAMLLFLGTLYGNREGFSIMESKATACILALVKPYKNYGTKRR